MLVNNSKYCNSQLNLCSSLNSILNYKHNIVNGWKWDVNCLTLGTIL